MDSTVNALVDDIMAGDYATGRYAEAAQNLETAKAVCEGDSCSPKVRARLLMAVGMTQTKLGNQRQAEKAFIAAVKEDSGAQVIDKYADDQTRQAFEASKASAGQAQSQGCRGLFKGGGTPPGWRKAEAYFCYQRANEQQRNDSYKGCVSDARSSLELEKRVGTRALLAECLEKDNDWTQAIEEWREVAREAPRSGQFTLARRAQALAAQLERRRPALILQSPKDRDQLEDLKVSLDDTELPIDILDTELPVNPGSHAVSARANRDGLPLFFNTDVALEPGKTITLPISFSSIDIDEGEQRRFKCLLKAKTPEEFRKCLDIDDTVSGDLSFRVGTEISAYHDTMNVDTVTPAVSFGVEDVTAGWGAGAAFLIDVVTAASTDIVATASPRWREVRFVPALNGHKKFDDIDVSLNGSLSHEPDYISASIGTGVTVDLLQKTVTPSLGFEYSHDVNGKADTAFDIYGLPIDRFAVNAGVGLVLTKATFGSGAFTFVHEDGDSSKPYRHIPLFRPDIVDFVPKGLQIDAVNLVREPERPLEQLPLERQRYALALSFAHRFSSATLRGSERLYIDSWGLFASTTDARFIYDIIKPIRVWPHLRFHAQSGADFYKLAYASVPLNANGQPTTDADLVAVRVPAIRTGDRELGPLIGVTGGLGAHFDFGPQNAYAITLNGDLVYTRFLNHLFVKDRYGYFGALSFEAEFE